MNIAYLILAHNQPLQLKRLVDRLNQENIHFFIHFDRKYKDVASVGNMFGEYRNVVFISEYDVYWGGFSTVRAAQKIMKIASGAPVDFKYYVYLSGQDYPIKSNEYINNFFENSSSDFIAYHRMEHLPDSFRNKYRFFHFLDFKYINPRDKHKSKLLYYINYGFYRRFGKFIPHRSFYKDFVPYFGSDWFTLTDDTVKYILEFVERNKDYSDFMKYTDIPNELFVHNILLNSPRKTNIYDYAKYLEWLNYKKEGELFQSGYSTLKYMDWTDRGKPLPATLDLSYFEDLRKTKDLFARKMDEKASADLLNKIDSELL